MKRKNYFKTRPCFASLFFIHIIYTIIFIIFVNKLKMINKNTMKNTKRICLTLDLINDPERIEKYKHYHSPSAHWDEINDGIKQAGIQVMDIYLVDNRMFMICEVDSDADFDSIWEKMGTFPRQKEWGELMGNFIQSIPGHEEKWVKMEKVFELR